MKTLIALSLVLASCGSAEQGTSAQTDDATHSEPLTAFTECSAIFMNAGITYQINFGFKTGTSGRMKTNAFSEIGVGPPTDQNAIDVEEDEYENHAQFEARSPSLIKITSDVSLSMDWDESKNQIKARTFPAWDVVTFTENKCWDQLAKAKTP